MEGNRERDAIERGLRDSAATILAVTGFDVSPFIRDMASQAWIRLCHSRSVENDVVCRKLAGLPPGPEWWFYWGNVPSTMPEAPRG